MLEVYDMIGLYKIPLAWIGRIWQEGFCGVFAWIRAWIWIWAQYFDYRV